MACRDCGDPEARASLDEVEVCDRCFDVRIAARTGMPCLPDPPAPLVVQSPDGKRHRLQYRIWRAPTGIEVQLEETGVAVGEGFQFAVLGDHDAEVDALVERARSLAAREIGHRYLGRAAHRDGWALVDDEAAGRLIWNDDADDANGRPYDVVIDGRTLSWEELGHALESYNGWRFRIVIEDSIDDARTDAEIIALPLEDYGV